jgi:malate dehydrogenase (oxaloacetate-decarboxylating)
MEILSSESWMIKLAISAHRKLGGKIAVSSKRRLASRKELNTYYTPGVGAVASYLTSHKKEVRNLTIKKNSVAIVSDGSAVLGLGNIGPEAAIPVMEGKAMIFKEFAGIDAYPIVLDTQNTDEIINAVKWIAPVFGGINLEDISAPRCFEIEKKLKQLLDIPVMHDDQHATAIVVLAGLINAFKAARKKISESKIVILGAGAAGNAVAHILHRYGAGNIIVVDSKGIINKNRPRLDIYKRELAKITNKQNLKGKLREAIRNADAFIGVSGPGLLPPEYIKLMAARPIVFAMANPIPEIMPTAARRAGAYIIATGRSDYQNQINNALVFPGIFRGALDNNVKKISEKMKLRAAKNLAALIKRPTAQKIIPSIFDKRVVKAIAAAIR